MFLFDMTMPNGAQCLYHVALRYEVRDDGTHAVVNSFHTEAREMISWQSTHLIPPVLLVQSLADVETILTFPGAPFAGGTIIPEADATLDTAKARKKAKLVRNRNAAEWAGISVTSVGKRIDTDPDSQRKIQGGFSAALLAQITGAEFSKTWTMADGTEEPFDGPRMIEVGLLVADHVDACQQRKKLLEGLIDEAVDVTELEAIDIETGWPPL